MFSSFQSVVAIVSVWGWMRAALYLIVRHESSPSMVIREPSQTVVTHLPIQEWYWMQNRWSWMSIVYCLSLVRASVLHDLEPKPIIKPGGGKTWVDWWLPLTECNGLGRWFQETDYFTPQGEFRVDAAGSPTLLNCLMYKLSYFRFGELQVSFTVASLLVVD